MKRLALVVAAVATLAGVVKEVRRDGWLGLRPLQQRRHARQRRFDENLLPLSREGFSRPCLHPLRALNASRHKSEFPRRRARDDEDRNWPDWYAIIARDGRIAAVYPFFDKLP